tara:strand:+ start:560 stop:907 length:348 start_codon:yes stop_codon:yes gene_type:complete
MPEISVSLHQETIDWVQDTAMGLNMRPSFFLSSIIQFYRRSIMATGTYIGDNPKLKDETALLQPQPDGKTVIAQFDNLDLGPELTHSWPSFPIEDFRVDVSISVEGVSSIGEANS